MHTARARRIVPDELPAPGRHQRSGEREPTDRPLPGIDVRFTLTEGFPRAMGRIGGRPRKPDDIPLDAFLQDCDALAQAHQGLGDHSFVAAPSAGVPRRGGESGPQSGTGRRSMFINSAKRRNYE
jgi:hypothetical protein